MAGRLPAVDLLFIWRGTRKAQGRQTPGESREDTLPTNSPRIDPGIPGLLSMLTLMNGEANLRFALTRCWRGGDSNSRSAFAFPALLNCVKSTVFPLIPSARFTR
jgi:hypothetical protein